MVLQTDKCIFFTDCKSLFIRLSSIQKVGQNSPHLATPKKRERMKPGQAFDQHCRCKIERERLQWDQKVTIIFYTSARFYWCASFIARDVQICEGKTTKIVSPPFIGNLP